MKIFHIMGAVSILSNVTFSRWSERLDGILLSLLHFNIGVIFNTWHCFACMDFVRVDRMAIEIFNDFDRVYFSFYLHFVWFHGFLDKTTDFSQSDIDSCCFDTGVGCIFDGL